MVTLLEEIDPEYYKDFIFTYKRGRKCMYAESKKVVYGTLEASLIFWAKLSKILEEMGYQRNEYDWCFINKIIDNKQCTILWHVDDLKTSHVDPAIVPSVLDDIDVEYGKIAKITITRGKVHKYLGMTIDYSSPGKVIFSMIEYIGKMLDNIPEDMKGESATPTEQHLFDIAEDATKLSQSDADLLHHFVAQLLYLSKRASPYIHLSVSFLFTIVRGPDTDDYKKLDIFMKYIQGTIGLPLIFSIDKSGNIKWYVDASFAVHKLMRSHTGAFLTMVTGGSYVQSSKHNLNTKSST